MEERVTPQKFLESMYKSEPYAPVLSCLPMICGYNYPAAIVLARILFWNNKLRIVLNGERVLAKSAPELAYETGVEEQTVGRACRYLKEKGIIDYKVKKFNKHPVMHIVVQFHVIFSLYKEKVESETSGTLEIPEYLLQPSQKKLKIKKGI